LVLARIGEWKPTLVNYGSTLTLQSAYTTDDTKNNQGLNNTAHRQAYRESMKVSTIGYVYHPDLMLFEASGSYGLNQSSLDTNIQQSSSNGGYDAYYLKALLLRAKPYTLEMSSQQDRPFTSSLNAGANALTRESEMLFKYKKGKHTSRLRYKNTTRLHDTESTAIDDYETYYTFLQQKLGKLQNFNFNASASHEDEKSGPIGSNLNTISQQGSLGNTFDLYTANFTTGVDISTTTQGAGAESAYSNDYVGLNESIAMDLPWNFASLIHLSTYQNDSTNQWTTPTEDFGATAMKSDYATTNHTMEFTLSQQLFDSLQTRLMATSDSLQTARNEEGIDPDTGESIGLAPVEGEDSHQGYSLSSQYQKMLPYDSVATGSVTSTHTQIKRAGLSSDPALYFSVQEQGGIIHLSDTADIGAQITVDVLRDNDTCTAAIKNPRAVNDCWITLVEPVDYELNKSTRDITIGFLSNNVEGLNFDSFPINDGIHSFTFRVTSFTTSADATSQTNSLGVGLHLFDFVSSRYQHTETAQQGSYAETSNLTPKVTDDTVSLGFSWNSLAASVSREWIQAETNEVITFYRASYQKSKIFFDRLAANLTSEARLGVADSANSNGVSGESEEKGYSYTLQMGMRVPYIDANLNAVHQYDYTNGMISRLVLNTEGISAPNQDLGINEQTTIRNTVALTKPFRIPWVEFVANSYIRYRWEITKGDSNQDISRLSYGMNAGRSWLLGSTTISLTANYAITDDVFDDIESQFISNKKSPREEQTNTTTLMLTVARRLF